MNTNRIKVLAWRRTWIGGLIANIFFSASIHAATFYVSPSGNNSNSGTAPEFAFQTLEHALSRPALAAGDTIQLAAGTHSVNSATRKNGAAGQQITIQGAGAGSTILTGRLTIAHSHYVVRNLTVDRNYLRLSGAGCTQILVEFCEFRRGISGILMPADANGGAPSFVTISNCEFHHPAGNGMVGIGGHDNVIENCLFRDSSGWDALRVFGNNNHVRNNRFIRIISPKTEGYTGNSISNHAVATGSKIFTVEAGLKFTPYELVTAFSIADPTKAMTGFVESYAGTTLAIGVTSFIGSGSASDWRIVLGEDDTNTNHADIMQSFVSSTGQGATNFRFHGNYVEDSTAQLGNVDHNAGNNISGDWYIYNNVFNRSRIQFNCYIPRVHIFNNTFYATIGTTGIRGASGADRGTANNMKIFNNLFIRIDSGSTGGGAYQINTANGSEADFNVVTSLTDTGFAGLTSAGPNTIHGGTTPDLLFANAAGGDFSLRDGAIAIDRGQDLTALPWFPANSTKDKNGTDRPQGAKWDIGALEKTGVPPIPAGPAITSHPANQSVNPGANVTFSVAATGDAPLSFQWKKDGVNLANGGNISGVTTANLAITNVATADAALYTVEIVNPIGPAVTSNGAVLAVVIPTPNPPVINTQPQSVAVLPGGTAQFTVAATGGTTLAYVWKKNGVNLVDGGNVAGATTSNLTLSNVGTLDAATYTVEVSSAGTSVVSSGAILTVLTSAPAITTQPISVVATTGSPVTFTAVASGAPTPTLQWRRNGASLTNGGNISGATASTLSLSSVSAADVGTYTLVADNGVSSPATSNGATLSISDAPSISGQPANVSALLGQTASFTVIATGPGQMDYTWYKDSEPEAIENDSRISGAKTATLTISSLRATDAGRYYAVVNNGSGFATSNNADLAVGNPPPVIVSQPASTTAMANATVVFGVTATGVPSPVFQWRKDGLALANSANVFGATTSTLVITNVTSLDSGVYSVFASNPAGSATSNNATLTVIAPPAFIAQPPGLTIVNSGAVVTLNTSVSGEPAPTYQWKKDGVNLANGGKVSGANTPNLTLTGVTSAENGIYTLVATNVHGSDTSIPSQLTVQASTNIAQVATVGGDVSFAVPEASGGLQWQVSTDLGNSWNNLANNGQFSGVATNTLTVADVTAGQNNTLFRLVSTGDNTVRQTIQLTVAQAFLPFPVALASDGSGNLFVADTSSDTIQKIANGVQVSLLAGSSGQTGTTDGTGSAARFNNPSGIVVAADGSVRVADNANATIRSVTSAGVVNTLAGSTTNRGNTDGTGSAATFSSPIGVGRDASGNLYVADSSNHTIRKVTPAGVVTTFAGAAGQAGSADGTGTTARFNNPTGVEVDVSGNVYVSDTTNNLIRKISSTGAVTTLAGLNGVSGSADGTGVNALFNRPTGLSVDLTGHIYVADTGNSTIRRVSPTGTVITVAGLPGIAGLKDGTGTNAWFNQPLDVSFDPTGFLYVADTGNAIIRRIAPDGAVTTLALAAVSNPGATPDPNLPTPPPTPAPPPSPQLPSGPTPPSSGGGGGGGGAPSTWFIVILGILWAWRARQRS